MRLQILGQLYPAASSNEVMFTAIGECVISSLVFCNTGAANENIRAYIVPAGEAGSSKNTIYYDMDLPANTTYSGTLGITMAEGDTLAVYAKLGTTAFHAFGQYK